MKPYQFLGYWGNSSANHPYFLNLTHSNPHYLRRSNLWGVIYLGISHISPLDNNTIAAVSASGFTYIADAWVKVKNNCLILGREPFGRVPLYWTEIEQVIWFASHIKLLLPLISSVNINLAALYGYTCFSYIPTPLTPIEGINSIPAGIELSFSTTKPVATQQYQWKSRPKQIKTEQEAIAQLQTLLKNAILRQIENLPNEPVGVFLSGGLDSSIVATLLVQTGVKVRAYTLDFGGYGVPEFPYAEQVANHLHIPLVKVSANPENIKQALLKTVTALDIPFGDGVTVPLYLLYQAASEETSIIFNGENGDQLFAGWTNKPLIAASIYQRENFIQQYLYTFHRFYGYEERVFQPDIYQQLSRIHPQECIKEALDPSFSNSLLDRLRRATLMLKGAQNIQPRATNLAFAHGLWVRSPFCDLPLAEWAFQVSGELFLNQSCEKYVLKKAVESWLPPEIVWRQKRGMGVPLTEWCLDPLWSTIGNWLNPAKLGSEGIFIPELATKIILEQFSGHIRGRRIGELIWLLLMWEINRNQILGDIKPQKLCYNPFWIPYKGLQVLSKINQQF